MAGSSLFTNFARIAKVLALLLFFLPFVTVSCSTEALERIQSGAAQQAPQMRGPSLGGASIPIADASGLNMALGQVSMRLPPTMSGAEASGPQTSSQPPEVPIEIGVIAGAVLILLALLGSILLKGSAGALAGIGGSVLAIGALCYSVFVSYPPAVLTAFAAHNPQGTGGGEGTPTPDQIAQVLTAKPATGFWLVLFMLVLAILFNALAMRKPAAPAASPPA